jgi:hypothetical protein
MADLQKTHREVFMKGFLGFVSNEPTQTDVGDQMHVYAKMMLSSQGVRVRTANIALLRHHDAVADYVEKIAPTLAADQLEAYRKKYGEGFAWCVGESWATDKVAAAHETAQTIFQNLKMNVIDMQKQKSHPTTNVIEVVYGFPGIENITDKTGIATLVLLPDRQNIDSCSFYAMGTPETLQMFMTACANKGLKPNATNPLYS